jgi:hypothetical protein
LSPCGPQGQKNVSWIFSTTSQLSIVASASKEEYLVLFVLNLLQNKLTLLGTEAIDCCFGLFKLVISLLAGTPEDLAINPMTRLSMMVLGCFWLIRVKGAGGHKFWVMLTSVYFRLFHPIENLFIFLFLFDDFASGPFQILIFEDDPNVCRLISSVGGGIPMLYRFQSFSLVDVHYCSLR